MKRLSTIGLAAVTLIALSSGPAWAATLVKVPVAATHTTVTELRGEDALAEIVGRVDEVQIKQGMAVIRYRTDPKKPAKPIRVDYHEALAGAGDGPLRVPRDGDISQFLALLAAGAWVLRRFRQRRAPAPIETP
jgi:hypothetical protein